MGKYTFIEKKNGHVLKKIYLSNVCMKLTRKGKSVAQIMIDGVWFQNSFKRIRTSVQWKL